MRFRDPTGMTDAEKIERICDLEEVLIWHTTMLHMNYHKNKKPELSSSFEVCDLPACKHAVKMLTKDNDK